MSEPKGIELFAPAHFPLVQEGDDLAQCLVDRLAEDGRALDDGDVVVFAQKVVSKAEGRRVDLATVTPSAQAIRLAESIRKDARLVHLILGESTRTVRARPGLLIVEHRLGFIMANAGIDQSNVAPGGDGAEYALLLPEDPDASAEALRERFRRLTDRDVAVIINDSFGRAWRIGTVGVAIGAAGLPSVVDRRGETDLFGRTLQATVIGFADEIAAAASLLMGQAREGRPAVVVRGAEWSAPVSPARAIVRPEQQNLFP